MTSTLYYAHDPMCSWCWAFDPTWKKLKAGLPTDIITNIVLGGLAPDSSEPMPEQMQQSLQATWQRISQVVPGTEFNHDFWRLCKPRRSTYPACRAVLGARAQNAEFEAPMISAIQHAYYLHARNPSDTETLIALSESIGCDADLFAKQLVSTEINAALTDNIKLAHNLGAQGFPSLILRTQNNQLRPIAINYHSAVNLLDQIARNAAA